MLRFTHIRGCSITAIMAAFQAAYAGSTPATRTVEQGETMRVKKRGDASVREAKLNRGTETVSFDSTVSH